MTVAEIELAQGRLTLCHLERVLERAVKSGTAISQDTLDQVQFEVEHQRLEVAKLLMLVSERKEFKS